MRSIFRFLLKTNTAVFLLSGTLFLLLVDMIGTSLPIAEGITNVNEISRLKELGALKFFVLAVLIVPFFETLIFQAFIIHGTILVFKKFKWFNFYLPIIMSAVAFGLWHNYNLTYFILRFIGGLVLAFLYIVGNKRKETGFLLIVVIHSILNIIPFAIDFF